jgi:dephospho-CoA kinase
MTTSEANTHRPLKLGVTGGVGSGKSVICDYLARKGWTVISADELARRAVMPGTEAYKSIIKHFGSGVVADDGMLDRKKLRNLITRDPDQKKALENFIHPEVFRLMEVEYKAAAERREAVVAVEVPLLFELGLSPFFDFTLTVTARRDIRIQRMMVRDNVNSGEADALLGIQMPDEEKIKQSDFVIDNNGTKEELYKMMDRFYEELIQRIKTD